MRNIMGQLQIMNLKELIKIHRSYLSLLILKNYQKPTAGDELYFSVFKSSNESFPALGKLATRRLNRHEKVSFITRITRLILYKLMSQICAIMRD